MKTSGNIPNKIRYYVVESKDEKGQPAFPCDADNKKTNETAKGWVKGWGYKEFSNKTYEKDNLPQIGFRINDLEVRNEGGRAYKVITPEGFRVDFREDVLMDTILAVGISPGGILNGEYIWATLGSQFRLILVGSELHKEILDYMQKKDLKTLTNKDLQPGGIYCDSRGDEFVFLGVVNGIKVEERNRIYTHGDYKYTYLDKPYKKHQLWLELPSYNKLDVENESITNQYIAEKYYYLKIVKNKNIKQKTGQYKISLEGLQQTIKNHLDNNNRTVEYNRNYYDWDIIK